MTPVMTAFDSASDTAAPEKSPRVLVTGATGYLGGRLAPRLLDEGYTVRVLARTPAKLDSVPWATDVEIVQGDLSDRESLKEALSGVDVMYYLVHSMGTAGHSDFADTERDSAENVAAVAAECGVGRIVYLGGLHPPTGELSPHLKSRAEVGRILIDSGVPTIVLQAGVVIGSGSASFEMIRHLTNRLPVMTTPRWVHNRIQPIAVRDVLHYLIGAASAPITESRTFDIGGPDVMQYGEMMNIYADVAGLRQRRIIVLPVLTPRLAGHWIGLVTPIPRGLAMPLIESLQYDAIGHEMDIDAVVPRPEDGLTGYRDSVRLALRKIDDGEVETRWTDATGTAAPSDPLPSDPTWAGEVVYTDTRVARSAAQSTAIRPALERLADADVLTGWHRDVTGPDASASGTEHTTRLKSSTRLPGEAWLDLTVGGTAKQPTIEQRLVFFPRGLAGRAVWYASLPVRLVMARRMLRTVVQRVDADAASNSADRRVGR
ncbi:nucleoside-diphosphate sugar epimerase [Rhodococcus sp. 15-725-2-2b]|nr:nucleoside-diphosphate sugar epimerase [Rhodococcus sp. 06-470-2]OZC71955.1 nucleoside-diphosphate sugar epimerase [Rhodococcus sp. 06-469-3-2]OZC82643.1 nucleoside-diphosphate sugar epimerase [Rhodococcus sp. 06-418-5]OZD39473.1 nucleoside-diphosphate sugar epimerase [Rhodococcus sp. 06-1477-1A]OZE06191.1 nucleoside-diphosphate sugar epimerase [Rhodococcus sp. 05-2255-3B1]OZE07400.1 nucleoside-diphosphate sugar epimerase [Rhodococcus sp. 05-2255-3C]OZE18343.1 nucleoside-diphosphate sugar 